MIYLVLLAFLVLLTVAFIRFVFAPYFSWKRSKQISRSLKSTDNIKVFFKGIEYIYQDFPKVEQKDDIEVSIVIPAFNEENRLAKTLGATIEYFFDRSTEIIVINDASTDKTKEIAKGFQKYAGKEVNLKVITYNQNKGKGGAVRLGMLIAIGQKILMMDADLATDLDDYPKVEKQLTKIQKNDLGLVTGSRHHLVKDQQAKRKPLRKFVAFVCNFIVNVICGVRLNDTQCGFKLFTRQTSRILFRVLHLERWAFDVELFMIAKKIKAPFVEVPVTWHDVDGSHLNVVSASITMSRDFLLVRVLYLLKLWSFNDDIGLI